MNYSIILNILGWVLGLQGIFMLPSCLVGLIYKEYHDALVYLIISVCCTLIGILLRRLKSKNKTFYAKEGVANLLIIYGKAEREKFEEIMESVSEQMKDIYERTEVLHDGKWLWIPLDDRIKIEDIIAMLKIKRKPNRK